MSKNWKIELDKNVGSILLPDNRWVKVEQPLVREWIEDVWSDPEDVISEPTYEQGIARFIESVVAAGFCRSSGSGRFNFIHQNLTARAKGDLFDHKSLYLDRETLPRLPQDEKTICDSFGASPRRTMSRLKVRTQTERDTLLQGRLLERMCWLSIARKVFLARAGHPEFCEPYAP